jgi:hypothetical protein
MRTLYALAVTVFTTCILASCTPATAYKTSAGSSQKAAAATSPLYPEIAAWLDQNKMTVSAGLANVPEHAQAFSQGAVISIGEGFPLADAEDPGKKRLTAIRAAEAAAQRNLLEFFARFATNDELKFTSCTARLEGFVKGAVIVTSDYNPDRERAAVLLRLDLQGARGFAK